MSLYSNCRGSKKHRYHCYKNVPYFYYNPLFLTYTCSPPNRSAAVSVISLYVVPHNSRSRYLVTLFLPYLSSYYNDVVSQPQVLLSALYLSLVNTSCIILFIYKGSGRGGLSPPPSSVVGNALLVIDDGIESVNVKNRYQGARVSARRANREP